MYDDLKIWNVGKKSNMIVCRVMYMKLHVCCFNFAPKVLDDGTLLKRYRKEISELKKQLVEVSVKLA